MDLNSQVEKWEQEKSIAIHRPAHSPLLLYPQKGAGALLASAPLFLSLCTYDPCLLAEGLGTEGELCQREGKRPGCIPNQGSNRIHPGKDQGVWEA